MLEDPIATKGDDEPLAADEVSALIAQFEASEWQRLKLAARRLGQRSGMDPEDLVQEACCRALRGTRKIDRDRDAIWTLIGAMRSLASQKIQKREGGPISDFSADWENIPSSDLDPELFVISIVDHGRTLAAIRNAIAGDRALENLVEALCDGIFGRRLEEYLGVDHRGLEALRVRLKRKLRDLALKFKNQQIG